MRHYRAKRKRSTCSAVAGATFALLLIAALGRSAVAAVLDGAPTALSTNNVAPAGLLGWSLALSANGQVAAGGAPSASSYNGAAYVYTLANGVWSDPATLPTTGVPAGGQFGLSVAVSADGTQVLAGAPDLNSYTGAVYVYTQTSGSWLNTPSSASLALPAGVAAGSSFGTALAVSSGGQTLIVGAAQPSVSGGVGALYAYTLSGTTWGTPTALPMTGIPSGSHIGWDIAVSADGSVVLAGSTAGAAYVWTESGGTWSAPLALTAPAGAASFGGSVALSADGTVALVGATPASGSDPAAYVYNNSGGSWSSTPATLTVEVSGTIGVAASVALAPNGQTAFIGLAYNAYGAVYASLYNGSVWGTPLALSTTNVPYSANLGIALAQADNGQELLTSGETANSNTGGLWVYGSSAAITLEVNPSAQTSAPGSSLTFTLSLANTDEPGATPATTLNNVVLTDTLPAGSRYLSSNAANGSCTDSGTTVTCTLSSLAPGSNSQNPWTPSITIMTPATASRMVNSVAVYANEALVGSTSVATNVTNDTAPTLTSASLSTPAATAVSGTLSATAALSGQTLTFTILSQPANGTVTLVNAATGGFTYTPNAGFTGIDTFVWTAGDGIVSAAPVADSIAVGLSSSSSTSTSTTKSGGGGAMGLLLLLSLLGALLVRCRGEVDGMRIQRAYSRRRSRGRG